MDAVRWPLLETDCTGLDKIIKNINNLCKIIIIDLERLLMKNSMFVKIKVYFYRNELVMNQNYNPMFLNKLIGFEVVLKIIRISNIRIGMDLNQNYLRNISMLDFVIIQIWLWKFERYRYIYRYFQYDICWSQNLILNISRYIFYSEPCI